MGKATEMIKDLSEKLDGAAPPNWTPVIGNVARLRVPRGWIYRAVAGMCFVPDPAFEQHEECASDGCLEPSFFTSTCRDCGGPQEKFDTNPCLNHDDVVGPLS